MLWAMNRVILTEAKTPRGSAGGNLTRPRQERSVLLTPLSFFRL